MTEKDDFYAEYLKASEDFRQATQGATIEAGQRCDYDYLIRTVRADLTATARSSTRAMMALETLNAFEEGMSHGRLEG